MSRPNLTIETVHAPLADYFFIAGVDSEQLRWGNDTPSNKRASNGTLTEATIQEDRHEESEGPALTTEPPISPRHVKRESYSRLSRLSNEARLSIQSINLGQEKSATDSNRSSATIKGFQITGTGALNDADFDKALRKFASERDSFLCDLSLSAGAVLPSKPKPRPRTQKIVNEDTNGTNGLKSGIGSVRRRISFRDMSSLKKQPSVMRKSSVRTSRRLSNYNSVIPNPQPLNIEANMHPLKHKFEPVLLDRYPPRGTVEEQKRRGTFPDYVPMFAFPNDVTVVSADERPRTTWHGFAMTAADGSKLHAICITVWMPLNPSVSEELERKCDEWRRRNMSDEERELANSLGERLAAERAKLSRLLSRLPNIASGSAERESLEEDISAVEEKIGLMTDLLRPVRHAAASKIEGLTDGETGFWIPRAYGILGRDGDMTAFWKEWLKAVVVPMTDSAILRVPASSPKVGMWQPLERYVVNLCAEALSPISSKTQVEIAIRELRLFARKEAANELPGSRGTDLYALFRALSIPNIIVLFEYVLSESRIILLSSHTAMLHLISKALVNLLYPLTWNGIFIPVLPVRLIQAVEAPCPYIVGIERRYEKVELPEDDFVLVDLDADTIESVTPPLPLPKQQRRKLISLLQLAAPHHNRFGVPTGPPAFAIEAFPFNAFSSENASLFDSRPPPTHLAKYASLNSTSFGDSEPGLAARAPVFNAFAAAKLSRPSTSSTIKGTSPPSISPTSGSLPPLPTTPVSRNDSGFALSATLREKRSGHLEGVSKRSSSFGFERRPTIRRPSIPINGHSSSLSMVSIHGTSTYAPSVYAQSTLAASTIMPNVLHQPVRTTDTNQWIEGHEMKWRAWEDRPTTCAICDERADEDLFRCAGCNIACHSRCVSQIHIVCSGAFHPEQIRAAFVRQFASLFYTYRKFLLPPSGEQRKNGLLYHFNFDAFVRTLPSENADYVAMLQQTQGFNEFIHLRETKAASDPTIQLFDQVIIAKKNRGRTSIFSRSSISFLSDTSDHLWRNAAAMPPSSKFPGDYRSVVSRVPAKLDPALIKEPRMLHGVPRIDTKKAKRKPIPSMLGPSGLKLNGLAISPP
ncbi:hypothetical protein MMC25_005377 [Agyrium rufum]|nr:hypothetical protein [Agyrium rufum]